MFSSCLASHSCLLPVSSLINVKYLPVPCQPRGSFREKLPVLCQSRVRLLRNLSVSCQPKVLIVKFLSALPSSAALPALSSQPFSSSHASSAFPPGCAMVFGFASPALECQPHCSAQIFHACHSISAFDQSAHCLLLAPLSQPGTIVTMAPPGSLVHLGQSSLYHCHRLPGLLLCLVPSALQLCLALHQ